MASLNDVRRIASKLPGAVESTSGQFAYSVPIKGKLRGFLWAWAERVHPKKPKVINDGVIAVVVPNQLVKEMLLGSDSNVYFTEDHYNGFPAVLVRLAAISADELELLVEEAWMCKAPPDTVKSYLAARD